MGKKERGEKGKALGAVSLKAMSPWGGVERGKVVREKVLLEGGKRKNWGKEADFWGKKKYVLKGWKKL